MSSYRHFYTCFRCRVNCLYFVVWTCTRQTNQLPKFLIPCTISPSKQQSCSLQKLHHFGTKHGASLKLSCSIRYDAFLHTSIMIIIVLQSKARLVLFMLIKHLDNRLGSRNKEIYTFVNLCTREGACSCTTTVSDTTLSTSSTNKQ